MSSIKLKQRTGSIKLKERTGSIEQTNRKIISARAAEAKYFDKNGILQTAAPHEVRYSKNFDTGQQELLLEDQATNLFFYSNLKHTDLGDNLAVNRTSDIGVLKMFKVTLQNRKSYSFIRTREYSSDSDIYTISCFLAKGSHRFFGLRLWGDDYTVFDVFEEEFIKIANNSISQNFTKLTEDFFRVHSVVNPRLESNIKSIGLVGSNGGEYNVSGGGSLFLSAPQIEKGSHPTSQIITSGEPVTRPADKLVFAS